MIDVTVNGVSIVKGVVGLITIGIVDNSAPLLKVALITVDTMLEVIDNIGLVVISITDDDSKEGANVDMIEVNVPTVDDMIVGLTAVAVTVISAVIVVGFINETVTVIVFCRSTKDVLAAATFAALAAVADAVAVAAPAAAPAAPAAAPAAPAAPTGPG